MPLVSPTTLLADARRAGTGLGAFNVILLEHAEAIAWGAERARQPTVLQISANTARYHDGLDAIGGACLAVARRASVPIAVHLDHAENEAQVDEAVALGLTSVMFDGASLPYAENVERTAAIVATCRAAGVAVEAELGEVGGKDGDHAATGRTDPDEAAAFVAATGVDALAVAVGTSHAMTDRSAAVDVDLVRRLAATVPVPLVLHGSSGVSDRGLAEAVRAGITKVNVATRLNQALTAAVRLALAENDELTDPRKYLGPGRDMVMRETSEILELLGTA